MGWAAQGVTAELRPSAAEPVAVLLMNTIWADRSDVHDALTTTAELSAWLAAVADRLTNGGTPITGVREQDLEEFRELRSALRRLAAEVTGDERARSREALDRRGPRWATDVLNTASAAAPPIARLSWPDRIARRSGPAGVRTPVAALSTIAAAAVDILGAPDAGGLRACPAPGCVLYFVKDHPRREWCSASCGNRARAQRHYQRHRRH
jgi:predicted RNA-binding Zn ribbon-like protein